MGKSGLSNLFLLVLYLLVSFWTIGREGLLTKHCTVSRWDRLLIFGACNLAALACFVICFVLFPVISLGRPRKLVIL